MEHREYTSLTNYTFVANAEYPMLKVGGPAYSAPDILFDPKGRELCASRSMSPFPADKEGVRLNDPISDRFYCSVYEDKFAFAIAQSDGPDAAYASEFAILGFIEHISQIQAKMSTTQDAARGMQRAFAKAHAKIMSRPNVKATTQLLGGIFGRLAIEGENRWAFVACSVGHCKAFTIHKEKSIVVDITKNNYVIDDGTPQGALGPVDSSGPNLSNMRLYFHMCKGDDVIILTTKGIHNNFHPQKLGMKPSELNMEAKEWSELTSDADKDILDKFICSKMKEFCSVEQNTVQPSQLVQNLLYNIYDQTEPGRKLIKERGELSFEEFNKFDLPCYMNHCTAFSIKATSMGNPETYIQNKSKAASFSKEIHAERNREWEWKLFIPYEKERDHFDIFSFLVENSTAMESVVSSTQSTEIEECFLHVKDCEIELRQKTPLKLELKCRMSGNDFTRIERWVHAGDLDLETLKESGKNTFLSSISNLLRHKAMDIRKINELTETLAGFNPQKDIFVLKGIRKMISLEKMGGKFDFEGSDLTAMQSNVSFTRLGNESDPLVMQVIEVHSKNESSLLKFISEIDLMDHWVVCSYSEFIESHIIDQSSQ